MSIVGSRATNFTSGSGPSNITGSSTSQNTATASLAIKAKMADLNANTATTVY
ncbi:hypothetical protein PGT21_012198 [Puccinia graminis f. sp. tritici]|uniref:Uncharacterized protein n=1 Tax=Puccinia graminis f. sp. tritici TaxID=56615 RepID=A0A5B0LZL6_PUCGR|nr:hypothetical protein PGT21_012198 [Puccinia graminis f. sp. tritici]